jgi:hypothetical protein
MKEDGDGDGVNLTCGDDGTSRLDDCEDRRCLLGLVVVGDKGAGNGRGTVGLMSCGARGGEDRGGAEGAKRTISVVGAGTHSDEARAGREERVLGTARGRPAHPLKLYALNALLAAREAAFPPQYTNAF